MDSGSVLINTDLSPASLLFPRTALDIVETYPVAQMLFFSTASIPMYCSGKQELASMANAQPLTAEQPTLLLSCWKCCCLIGMRETRNHICRMGWERPRELMQNPVAWTDLERISALPLPGSGRI